jgi:hypothetical protein
LFKDDCDVQPNLEGFWITISLPLFLNQSLYWHAENCDLNEQEFTALPLAELNWTNEVVAGCQYTGQWWRFSRFGVGYCTPSPTSSESSDGPLPEHSNVAPPPQVSSKALPSSESSAAEHNKALQMDTLAESCHLGDWYVHISTKPSIWSFGQ